MMDHEAKEPRLDSGTAPQMRDLQRYAVPFSLLSDCIMHRIGRSFKISFFARMQHAESCGLRGAFVAAMLRPRLLRRIDR